jgi:hypothetical protein
MNVDSDRLQAEGGIMRQNRVMVVDEDHGTLLGEVTRWPS